MFATTYKRANGLTARIVLNQASTARLQALLLDMGIKHTIR